MPPLLSNPFLSSCIALSNVLIALVIEESLGILIIKFASRSVVTCSGVLASANVILKVGEVALGTFVVSATACTSLENMS